MNVHSVSSHAACLIVSQSTLTQLFPAEAKDKTIPTLPSKDIDIACWACVCGDIIKVAPWPPPPVYPSHNGFIMTCLCESLQNNCGSLFNLLISAMQAMYATINRNI